MRRPIGQYAGRIAACAAIFAMALAGPGCRQQAAQDPGPTDREAGKARTPYYHGLIAEYRTNLSEDPHNLAAMTGLANALSDAGQWQEAITYYEKALKLNPHNASVITDLGLCYKNLGMIDRALDEFHRALKVEPTNAKALFNMGHVYGVEKKDYRKAIAAWEQLLRVAPNDPKASYVREHIQQFRQAGRSGTR